MLHLEADDRGAVCVLAAIPRIFHIFRPLKGGDVLIMGLHEAFECSGLVGGLPSKLPVRPLSREKVRPLLAQVVPT